MSALKIVPLGGLGEIGMNCLVLESDESILIIDCGLHFSDLEHFGVEYVIPDFTYLLERKEKVKGFILTHGHEDHIGALPFALKSGIRAPLYCSAFTSLLVQERLKEYGLLESTELFIFKMGEVLNFGEYQIETVSVNHSIVDAAALIIQTPVGKIIHTGDFKIDPTPFLGQTLDEKKFQKAGREGVLLLLSDSTNVERHEHSLSESVIYQKFEQLFAAAQGLTLVSMFASNIARMAQVFDLAEKLDRKIALAGRTMEQNVRLGAQAGYLTNVDQVLIPLESLAKYPREKLIVLSTGSQGEARSALIRIAQGEHAQIKLEPQDRVIMSSKFIPGNEKAIGRMINQLFKQGADVVYESVHEIHVSGHATQPELKKMLEWTKPRFFIPIHGEYRHLVHHARLAQEVGLKEDHILVAVNGDVLELTPHQLKKVEHLEETRVLIEGREGNDVTKLLLKERRQIGEKGIVFSLLVRHRESHKIVGGPEIISKGLASEELTAQLIEGAKKLVLKVVKDSQETDLQETIRVELRRFFASQTGKKPIVLPIVLDL